MRASAVLFSLLAVTVSHTASAAGYVIKQGKGYAICEAFKKRLDKLGSLKEPFWIPDMDYKRIIWEIPGIKEAAWRDLDVDAHMDLFETLIRYDMLSFREKMSLRMTQRSSWNPGAEAEEKRPLAEITKPFIIPTRDEVKAGKAKLQVLRANIQLVDEAPETLARIWWKRGPGKYEYGVIMYLVTDDLKSINVAKEKIAHYGSGGDVVVYGGKHYIVDWEGRALIARDFGSGLVPFCAIEFDWITRRKEMKK
ncbi:hypothetical protein sS8_0659 [Methylocaldum marinum]|uniref:Uncharacterized protein n=2 Tax=Methylocaldum marinum TaxID=1432792 RepID=A0A250KM35_9GAMM|nr:hypothetical protein sS8_0659 [Methylocaldum marinum]